MHHKTALYLSQTADGHERMRRLSSLLDVSVLLAGVSRFSQVMLEREFDLIVLELGSTSASTVEHIESTLADNSIPLLLVVAEEQVADLHLPMRPVCDFILDRAPDVEYALRMRHLLWPGEETGDDDVVAVDELSRMAAVYAASPPVCLLRAEAVRRPVAVNRSICVSSEISALPLCSAYSVMPRSP